MPLLSQNIKSNASSVATPIEYQELDWKASVLPSFPIDLIITSDTIYAEHLFEPLLRTLHHFTSCSPGHTNVLLGLERRDSQVVDRFLKLAHDQGWAITRIDPNVVHHCGSLLGWHEDDYDGVELWSLKQCHFSNCEAQLSSKG